ncbi:hypothetical protein GPLA_4634 [Paraglaciecola polaris LMG 21857]|uniref:Uncharacterized protein n=1 Tax=Paraglaciecola polaris LMG 21857 TaxID=1129793 RepID=K7A3N4_9ALTE|nr:hypothetical protein GPLA_4634 [Paraglaciecola polaris LMG 21857]
MTVKQYKNHLATFLSEASGILILLFFIKNGMILSLIYGVML